MPASGQAARSDAKPDTAAMAPVWPLERLTCTRAVQLDLVGVARAARRREVALRRLRTLCEDADELLGQVAEAARFGDAEAALGPLTAVRDVARLILQRLRRPVPAGPQAARPDALEEDRVLATLALVEELDFQLRDAHIGYRGAGWRAGLLAEKLVVEIDQLTAAAASGRTRAHASGVAEDVA